MLNSLLPQLSEHDCVTIVFDGNSEIPVFDFSLAKCKVVQYCEPEALGYWGHGIRNKYASLLETRDFVVHADDDDEYTRDAFEYLRMNCVDKTVIYFALMFHNPYFSGYHIERGHIGTPCGIIPYEYNKNSTWGELYGGDASFYENLVKKYPGSSIFLNKCIYIICKDMD
jgi:hypothetical protein